MSIWRMSFRVGTKGYEMWPFCLNIGVAAITYSPLDNIDLNNYANYHPVRLWNQLSPTQKASLGRVAYKMRKGDTIFVKKGPKIICRGTVTGSYRFDSRKRIIDPNGTPWCHQVPVKWEKDFPEINILLGGEQVAVLELKAQDVGEIDKELDRVKQNILKKNFIEGQQYKSEVVFRVRNRALIEAKKSNSDYTCEVCGFSFYNAFGDIGKEFIIAHHKNPLAGQSGNVRTTLQDIALVCANCHSMIHNSKPILTIQQLKDSLKLLPLGLSGRL